MRLLELHIDGFGKFQLGLGKIGEEALRRVVTHPALQGRPFILETPNEDDGYAREIAMVRKWQEQ